MDRPVYSLWFNFSWETLTLKLVMKRLKTERESEENLLAGNNLSVWTLKIVCRDIKRLGNETVTVTVGKEPQRRFVAQFDQNQLLKS